jgi:hypothetical protein
MISEVSAIKKAEIKFVITYYVGAQPKKWIKEDVNRQEF